MLNQVLHCFSPRVPETAPLERPWQYNHVYAPMHCLPVILHSRMADAILWSHRGQA